MEPPWSHLVDTGEMAGQVAREELLLLVRGVVGVDEGRGGRRLVVVLVVVLLGLALLVRQDGGGRVLTARGNVVAADDPARKMWWNCKWTVNARGAKEALLRLPEKSSGCPKCQNIQVRAANLKMKVYNHSKMWFSVLSIQP